MLDVNQEVAGWQILKVLGAGDFGAVYLVERHGVRGAMKTCTGKNASALARLRVEIESLRMFDHPGIPQVLDADLGGTDPYLVMSLAPGQTLLSIVEMWNSRGRVHGDVEAAEILRGLMSAIEHVHSLEQVHRDIKEANVLYDEQSGLTSLIDFGFCKRAGDAAMRDKDSFWRAGAARFGPPSKLEDPSLAVASHDVFAAGVIGYYLLTGRHPWSVGREDGLAALKLQMRSAPLVQVHHVNPLVHIDLSRFISALLTIDDDLRPESADAVSELDAIIESLRAGSRRTGRPSSHLPSYSHVVRDQMAGDVRLTDLEYQALNTHEMQRLRWIKQLGLTNFIYPGAEHSRLAHSIGTLNKAETMLRAIEETTGSRVDPDTRSQIRLYALTHDVSHVSAGHTVEDQLGIFERHDRNLGRFQRLVNESTSELGTVLRTNEVGRSVIRYLDPDSDVDRNNIVEQSVSGSVGADVLDYIDRDAYNCGLDHRVDTALFRQLRIDSKDPSTPPQILSTISGKYGLRVDREYAIESLLYERYAMFLKVYTHSAKLAADAVLGKALTLQRPKEVDYEWLGDEGVLMWLSRSRKDRVKDLAARLLKRNLPRGVLRSPIVPRGVDNDISVNDEIVRLQDLGYLHPEGRAEVELKIARRAKVDVERVFFYCPKSPPGYKRAEFRIAEQGDVYSRAISKAHVISRRHLDLWEIWVFVSDADDDLRMRVAKAAEEVINRQNLISQYRRPTLDLGI